MLGRLEVRSGETRLELRGQQQQLVLALLLADSGASVSTEALIDELTRVAARIRVDLKLRGSRPKVAERVQHDFQLHNVAPRELR